MQYCSTTLKLAISGPSFTQKTNKSFNSLRMTNNHRLPLRSLLHNPLQIPHDPTMPRRPQMALIPDLLAYMRLQRHQDRAPSERRGREQGADEYEVLCETYAEAVEE